jgi:hypothetical protein
MKTEDLIDMLARGAGAAPRAPAAARLLPALLLGAAAALAAARLFKQPVAAALWAEPAMWLKLAYAFALVAAGGWLTARLGRPLPRTRGPLRLVLAVVAAMGALGLVALLSAPDVGRLEALLGQSWRTCPRDVLLLSLPALAASLWALRGLAPTRTRAAGAAAGVLSGAVGAFGYAFSCPELSPAFVAVWYTLGIVAAGALGALLGPRVLRW